MYREEEEAFARGFRHFRLFTEVVGGINLRGYQLEAAQAIIDSVKGKKGLTIVVVFPRQSGKNELQAQIEAYLLTLHFHLPSCEMVKVSPTWRPQSENAMRRLERVLRVNFITQQIWSKGQGYVYRVGAATIYFFSGQETANIVGATASLLLELDEAQDITISKYDKEIAPMAASTNATRVFFGTAWTSKTLLARERRSARKAELKDKQRRVFMINALDVYDEVPAYKAFVEEQVAKLGRNHPMIKTQYFSEEIDAEGGMFDKKRRTLMQGKHLASLQPAAGCIYAMTLDLAGEDEGASDDPEQLQNPLRDSTALTIFEVDLTSLEDEHIAAPTYKVVNRIEWVGEKHTKLYAQISSLINVYNCQYIAVDATGVGAGLTSFLINKYDDKVIPFIFTSKSKSDLGWNFLAVIETGRYKEYVSDAGDPLHSTFWHQVENCEYTIREGVGRMMQWGVPDGSRDPATGDLLHDDLVISAALCALFDELEWYIKSPPKLLHRPDPLDDIDEKGVY
jgi:hypothetical protein